VFYFLFFLYGDVGYVGRSLPATTVRWFCHEHKCRV